MMKKILALVLVIATMALVLTGCAYRYDKKDMSQFAKADYSKLDALLAALEIEDGDFGRYIADSKARDAKVLEKIDSILAEKIKAEDANKLKGDADKYGFRQQIYFAFYCSVEKDGETLYFDTKNMDDTKLSKFLSNPKYSAEDLSATEELLLESEYLRKVFAAINTLSVKDYAYDSVSSSSEALKTGDLVFVTYKYTYTEGGVAKSITSEYMPITVAAAEGSVDSIAELLNGKKLGKVEGTAAERTFKDPAKGDCVVDSMTVHFKSTGNFVTMTHIPYTTETKVTNAADTATASQIDLKDKEVTYYIYPAYAYQLADYSATDAAVSAKTIVEVIFGESITTSSLPCFTDDEDLKKIVEAVVKLKSTYDQLNSKATATGATQKQKDDAKEAKADLDAALKTLYEDLLKKDSAVDETILEEYAEKIYEDLETTYDKDIRTKLAAAIWAWAEKNITVDQNNLPKSAVKEAREQILAVHKNTFYTGKDAQSKPFTEVYKDSFQQYLANGVAEYKGKDVDAEIDKEAKADVTELIRIYAIAQHYEKHVARVTNADVSLYIDELYPSLYYNFYLSGNYNPTVEDVRELYGDTALRASLTFNRIMDYFLATEDADKDGHISYKNVTIVYK